MQITKGSDAAEELFAVLRNNGLLVDVYSEKFLASIENDWEGCSQLAFVEQKNKEFGTDSIGHMTIAYLHKEKIKDLKIAEKLVAIFPSMNWLIDSSIYQPNFLFINLTTHKILCAGLGKKNRLSVFDADNREKVLGRDVDQMSPQNRKFFEEFTKLDYASFVADFLENLEKLGQSNSYLANEWDGEEDSAEYMDADDGIFEAMNFFRTFFPSIDAEDLDSEID